MIDALISKACSVPAKVKEPAPAPSTSMVAEVALRYEDFPGNLPRPQLEARREVRETERTRKSTILTVACTCLGYHTYMCTSAP